MGMYTELVMAFELKEDVSEEIVNILKYMVGDLKERPPLPNDELFSTARWETMLLSDSYYFDGDTRSTIRYDDISKTYYVTIRCNLKNYDNEIDKFINWIDSHVDKIDGDEELKGYYRYEEDYDPTLIYI